MIKVLFAEDYEAHRTPVADFLRARGLDVLEVESPEDAKKALDQGTFDVVLLDVEMPEGDKTGASKVLEHMNKSGIKTPVIIVTAFGLSEDTLDAKKKYGNLVKETLNKHIDAGDILDLISKLLGDTKRKGAAR